jgi:hypothetical protein
MCTRKWQNVNPKPRIREGDPKQTSKGAATARMPNECERVAWEWPARHSP